MLAHYWPWYHHVVSSLFCSGGLIREADEDKLAGRRVIEREEYGKKKRKIIR